MKDEDLKFLIEKCGLTKDRAIEILKDFQEIYKVAQKAGYKLS